MTATYTFDVFSSLDGYGSFGSGANWTGYWGKQGPELLDHRLALYDVEQRMVFGANTYREFARMLTSSTEPDVHDPWVTRMRSMPPSWLGLPSDASVGYRPPRPYVSRPLRASARETLIQRREKKRRQ